MTIYLSFTEKVIDFNMIEYICDINKLPCCTNDVGYSNQKVDKEVCWCERIQTISESHPRQDLDQWDYTLINTKVIYILIVHQKGFVQ